MPEYPLLFRITHAVRCAKFEALVITDGRALMAFEDDEWWCNGVDPGGLTENGEGPLVAFQRFRKAFQEVLDDLAEDGASFGTFEREAREFFATDGVELERWQRALEELQRRSGEQLEEPFRDMPRMVPRPSMMSIKLLSSYAHAPMVQAKDEETVALPKAA